MYQVETKSSKVIFYEWGGFCATTPDQEVQRLARKSRWRRNLSVPGVRAEQM